MKFNRGGGAGGDGKKKKKKKDGDGDGDNNNDDNNNNDGGWWKFFSNLALTTPNRALTKDDLVKPLDMLEAHLVDQNVARAVAGVLCGAVQQSLLGTQSTSSDGAASGMFAWRSSVINDIVKHSIRDVLKDVLRQDGISAVDMLREVRKRKEKKMMGRNDDSINSSNIVTKPYTIVFCGVNGVGKSTSLAKVAAWLKQSGITCMVAACDTFRSGAVEQLAIHSDTLGLPLFQRGYNKDASGVCQGALALARRNGVDCVLVDTAGRMQDNEPLMRSLGKLCDVNGVDVVLFVGEALVGNEAVDQCFKFNRALQLYSAATRQIDGILLTKFDTIDDKVGAAVSMAYTMKKPIVFVGTGQKYCDLKTLGVDSVVETLVGG